MPRDYKSFPRVYVSADLAADTPVMLDADQSNHLVNVLRLKEGDGAILFCFIFLYLAAAGPGAFAMNNK